MSDIQARIVLCILHDRPEAVKALCAEFPKFEYDSAYSGAGPDDRMLKAFAISDNTVRPSLLPDDTIAIRDHQNVAYVLSPRIDGVEVARDAIAFVWRAFGIGARAVKCESSGLAHGRRAWLELANQSGGTDRGDAVLFDAWVRRPIQSQGGAIYSCGMHLLGHRDIEVIGEPANTALEIIDVFAMYVLIDRPIEIRSGQTFGLSETAPRFRIDLVPCQRYPRDDFFHNPNGYWRLIRL